MSVPPNQVIPAGGAALANPYELQHLDPDSPDPDVRRRAVEENLTKKFFEQFSQARSFDAPARKRFAVDRRYAAGTQDMAWAVMANLIGSMIDILASTLYARDPDVSCRKTPQADVAGSLKSEQLARSIEIVVSKLWKRGALKRKMRKIVRSILSVGQGWLKVVLHSDRVPAPELESAINDVRDNLAKLEAAKAALAAAQSEGSQEQIDQEMAGLQAQQAALTKRIEASVKVFLAIDFVKAENIQVSLDVECIEDYLDSDCLWETIYVPSSELKERFPQLTDEDIRAAKGFTRKKPHSNEEGTADYRDGSGTVTADDADNYTAGTADKDQTQFARVVECWDRRDNHIRTAVDGIKVWAKPPYQPPYGTSRFFPYFYFSFYEVDGERHPQSLSWRLHKLQDEYASTRSNYRTTRDRSIPGIFFNGHQISDVEAAKFRGTVPQEYTAINLADPSRPMQEAFAEKPVAKIDPRLYDTQPILNDMERMAGVQEAQTAGINTAKTATEAEIQQSGFSARTGSDRDMMETVLTDMANYTAEAALQVVPEAEAVRMAGSHVFWPVGMSIDDLTTLVEVDIEAGTTGKPRNRGDREAWATVLPLIKELQANISQLRMVNPELAEATTELLKETMRRMGDESDTDRFIPRAPAQPPVLGAPGTPLPGGLPTPAPAGGGSPALPI